MSVPEHNTCCPRNPRRPGRGERRSVGGMQEGGPGLGRMLRRGAGQRPKRRERVLRGCRRAVGGAPPALSPWHHRLPQMCPERRKSSTNSAFAGFCPPAALSRPVPREIPARLLQRFNLLRAGSECADYFLPLTSPLPSLVKGLFCMRSESLGFPQWQNWDWNPSLGCLCLLRQACSPL